MSERTLAPYGAWRSPITAELISRGSLPLSSVTVDGSDIYWLEGRPGEGGRIVLVKAAANGSIEQLTPPGFNVRTRAHEYGGGSYLVHRSTLFFSNFADQRLYRQSPGEEPRPITPEPNLPAGARFADARVLPGGHTLVCVRELHAEGREAVNEIVVLPADGSSAPRVIVSGSDFYSSPRISPDGKQLAWLNWNHPLMPWDGTELWVAALSSDGSVSGARLVAGGESESIFQPDWSPDGVLHFVSDRTGWWNLYRWERERVESLAPMESEFGGPQWQFGASSYSFLSDGSIVCIYTVDGTDHLGIVKRGSTSVDPVTTPYTAFQSLPVPIGERLALIAASPTETAAVVVLDLASGAVEALRRSLKTAVDPRYISVPSPIEYPTEGGRTAHAIYYPPANADFAAPEGELPPLLVLTHGGPTAMVQPTLSLSTQYWTSRGFAVLDVNYGGSTGYGREYRERLKGQWGIVDVEDCVNAARYLSQRGDVDGRRMAIRGGSAGGYTTLAALAFTDVFAAGASHFGVADLEALAVETHKFESRYLDGLVGPYPAAKDVYHARSPIYHADRITSPVILFQGLEDRVVPPAQAEVMVTALRERGVPVAYLAYEGEQHGFRKAENIQRTLEAELYFYGRVFGFTPAEEIDPVAIEGLAS